MKARRKKILYGFLVIDVIFLLTLIFIYLLGTQDALFKIKEDETDLPQAITTQQPDSRIQITINPTPINSYLSNPGIGWQDDINDSSGYLPETVAYSDRRDISWDILNPFEGIYNWAALDRQLSLAVDTGRLFSFRVYSMAGETFGGHKIPLWVLEKGAKLLPSGEPDYSNCDYQEAWGRFVKELINRYDGNANIAFIDISGYGNFNEWSWQDNQTQWDELWEQHYADGTANAHTIQTIDGQARRRLADMFIGGAFDEHQCIDNDGALQTISYSYEGFRSTQLVMPFAGIVQSTQYVSLRRPDVGFRYDSLGRSNSSSIDKVGNELSRIWRKAPIVFEFSKPDEFDEEAASQMLLNTHASLVHNNDYQQGKAALQSLLTNVGYRYFLKQAQLGIEPMPGGKIDIDMIWQNVGIAPNYPKMGQKFQIHVYLVDQQESTVADYFIPGNISSWIPSETRDAPAPAYELKHVLYLPENIDPGAYRLTLSILDVATNQPINLAISDDNKLGRYLLTEIIVRGN